MSYAVAADIKIDIPTGLLAQLTSDSGTTITDQELEDAATVASATMDRYLLGRYVTPVAGPSSVLVALRSVCLALVGAQLFQGRLLAESYKSFDDEAKDAMTWLLAVQNGKQSLPGAAVQSVSSPSSADDFAGGYDRVYGPSSDGYLVIL